jgi:hypothetical protein
VLVVPRVLSPRVALKLAKVLVWVSVESDDRSELRDELSEARPVSRALVCVALVVIAACGPDFLALTSAVTIELTSRPEPMPAELRTPPPGFAFVLTLLIAMPAPVIFLTRLVPKRGDAGGLQDSRHRQGTGMSKAETLRCPCPFNRPRIRKLKDPHPRPEGSTTTPWETHVKKRWHRNLRCHRQKAPDCRTARVYGPPALVSVTAAA